MAIILARRTAQCVVPRLVFFSSGSSLIAAQKISMKLVGGGAWELRHCVGKGIQVSQQCYKCQDVFAIILTVKALFWTQILPVI